MTERTSGTASEEANEGEKAEGGEDTDDGDTADTMRVRAGDSRVKLWLLLRANRLVVVGES